MTPFSDSVFMLFHMVASVLLSMVAFSTILWLVKILQQPIRIFAMAVDRAAMENKTEATMWKSIKNWIRNRCHKWVYILFGVTCQKNKQWHSNASSGICRTKSRTLSHFPFSILSGGLVAPRLSTSPSLLAVESSPASATSPLKSSVTPVRWQSCHSETQTTKWSPLKSAPLPQTPQPPSYSGVVTKWCVTFSIRQLCLLVALITVVKQPGYVF